MTTPTTTAVSERALLMLDIIARAEEPPTLNELMTMIGLPKATTHRFVTLLEKLGFAQRTIARKTIRNRVPPDFTRDRRDAPFISTCAAPRDPLGIGERDRRDLQHHDARRSRADLSGSRRIRLAAADSSRDRIACSASLHRERQAVPESCTCFTAKSAFPAAPAAKAHAANHCCSC